MNDRTVTLTPTGGGEAVQATTGSNGIATLEVQPGSYAASLSGSAPEGAVLSSATTPVVVAPAQGDSLSAEFRFSYYPGSIAGVLYRDENDNQTFDAGTDTPAPGIPVTLFAGSSASGDQVATGATGNDGSFSFVGLRPGDYTLEFSPFPTMTLVGGNAQTVTVGPQTAAPLDAQFTGNLLSPIGDVRTETLDGVETVVAVKGVVTWQPSYPSGDAFSDELFIQDASGGIQIYGSNSSAGIDFSSDYSFAPGDTLIIVGTTQLRFGEPQITSVTAVLPQGQGAAPAPKPVAAADIGPGVLHELVTIRGTVTNIQTLSYGNHVVSLSDATGNAFGVYVDSRIGVEPGDWLIGGVYDVTGVVNYDNRYEPSDYPIWLRYPSDKVPAEEPTPIADARALAGDTVTIAGTVTLAPGPFGSGNYYVQDNTGGILVYQYGASGYAVGDRLLITGAITAYHGEVEMSALQVTNLSSGSEPTPVTVTVAQLNAGEHQGELATVTGLVVHDVAVFSYDNHQLTTTDAAGDTLVVYVDSRTGIGSADWETGATYDITGIVSRYYETIELKPRQPSDATKR